MSSGQRDAHSPYCERCGRNHSRAVRCVKRIDEDPQLILRRVSKEDEE